jgi:hypothetical protein
MRHAGRLVYTLFWGRGPLALGLVLTFQGAASAQTATPCAGFVEPQAVASVTSPSRVPDALSFAKTRSALCAQTFLRDVALFLPFECNK